MQEKAVALVSGGIDSPVAAWLMMEKGVEVVALFMNPQPLVDERAVKRAEETARKIVRDAPLKFYIAPYGEVLGELLKKGGKLGCILCKRMMYRVASLIAEKEGAKAIITGESLGQVASQTIQNLQAISGAAKVSVLRPLVGMDKMEVVELARKIGTYEASIIPAKCCAGPPLHPATRANLKNVEKIESEFDINKMAEEIAANAKVVFLDG